MKAESICVVVPLVCVCMIGLGREILAQTSHTGHVASRNIVMSVGAPDRLIAVSGGVVQLGQPGGFADAKEQPEEVLLKGVYFDADIGSFRGNQFVVHDWFKTLKSSVEEIVVGGTRIDLLQKSSTNDCLMTEEFGAIPVAFTSGGQTPNSNTIYRCALAFNREQLAKLRKQIAEKSDEPRVSSGAGK